MKSEQYLKNLSHFEQTHTHAHTHTSEKAHTCHQHDITIYICLRYCISRTGCGRLEHVRIPVCHATTWLSQYRAATSPHSERKLNVFLTPWVQVGVESIQTRVIRRSACACACAMLCSAMLRCRW